MFCEFCCAHRSVSRSQFATRQNLRGTSNLFEDDNQRQLDTCGQPNVQVPHAPVRRLPKWGAGLSASAFVPGCAAKGPRNTPRTPRRAFPVR